MLRLEITASPLRDVFATDGTAHLFRPRIHKPIPARCAEPMVTARGDVAVHGTIPHIVPSMLRQADGAGVVFVLVPFLLPQRPCDGHEVRREHGPRACDVPEGTNVVAQKPSSHAELISTKPLGRAGIGHIRPL